jgi:hypothetical protein
MSFMKFSTTAFAVLGLQLPASVHFSRLGLNVEKMFIPAKWLFNTSPNCLSSIWQYRLLLL